MDFDQTAVLFEYADFGYDWLQSCLTRYGLYIQFTVDIAHAIMGWPE